MKQGTETAMSITCTAGNVHVAPTDQVSDTSDAALIQSIAADDKRAMHILFTRHNVRVFRFVLRLVGDKSMLRATFTGGFLAVGLRPGNSRARSEVPTGLWPMAVTKSLSALRRRPTGELEQEAAATIEDTADDPEAMMQNRQKADVLLQCLTQLSPAHREVIDLVYYHEKSIEEVAKIIGVLPNTVKTRMFYARKRIADLMTLQGIDRAVV